MKKFLEFSRQSRVLGLFPSPLSFTISAMLSPTMHKGFSCLVLPTAHAWLFSTYPKTDILGDPGADSGGEGKSKRAEKYGTKKSKERREEPLGTMSYQTSSKRNNVLPDQFQTENKSFLEPIRSQNGDDRLELV